MSDQAAVQPHVEAPLAVPTLEDRQIAASKAREVARQSRRASAVAKISASHAAEAAASAEPVAAPAPDPVKPTPVVPVAPVAAKPAEAAKPAAAEPAKPAEPTPDDAATQRGLSQIEHARKRFLDEQAAHKAELDVQRAEVARLRQEAQGKVTSIEELKKLDLSTLLDKLGLDDARLAHLSRESYYRTAEGQKNPSAKQAVEEIRQRSSVSTLEQQIAELRRELAETKESATAAQKLVFQREYANEWTDGALKAVPADKPSHFAKLLAKDPRTAKTELLALGGELEKEMGTAPTAAAVLAEYEKRERERLEARGYDPDAVLGAAKPAAAAAAAAPAVAAKPARTLEPGATQITRPEQVPTTREERRANAVAKIRMRQRTTADQVQ